MKEGSGAATLEFVSAFEFFTMLHVQYFYAARRFRAPVL